MRVTNPDSSSQIDQTVDQIYVKHEQEKKRTYNDRVLNNEHGSFTPLIYTLHGGMAPECSRFHKHLADKIARKTNQPYEKMIRWIRCKLSFVIIRSALLCVRHQTCQVSRFELDCPALGP